MPGMYMMFWTSALFLLASLQLTVSNHYGSCIKRGCPDNFVCERREYRRRRPECVPDSAAAVSARLMEWNSRWNAGDYQALEEFYTVDDSLFLPPGAPIRRGRAGFAGFISNLIAANNWGTGTWTVDSTVPMSGNRVASVDVFEIQSSIVGDPATTGKDMIVWKLVNGEYLIEYECLNFN